MTKLRNTFLSLGLAIIASLSFVQPASADVVDIKQPLQTAGIITTPITASNEVVLSYPRSSVSSTPAPKMEAPVVAVQYNQPEATTTVTRSAPVAKKNVALTPQVKSQYQPVASVNGSLVAAAALAQLGVSQDCTALVTNALRAVGIHHHGWPASYLALGTQTSNPVPGDLIYYANGGTGMAHIAVYIGNGQAVHGGWNGGTTAIFSANVGSGPVYIHI